MKNSRLGADDFRLAAVALAERRLSRFVRLLWHVVEPATPYQHNWHIDAICEHLEACSAGQIRNLLINIPPRFMKSLAVGVMWPSWTWIENPASRWMFSTYSQTLSYRDSLKCRDVIRSPLYQACWGDRFQLRIDQNAKGRFDNDKTGFRLATSVGGLATGEGGDFIVFDDPHNIVQGESDAARQAVIDWWDTSMSTRGNNPATVCRVGVMQRINENDLAGHVLEQGGYVHLCLPMEYDPTRSKVTSIGWKDPRTEPGELLWPDRFNAEHVADLKLRLGGYGAAGQLNQNPVPSGGGVFDRNNFRTFSVRSLDAGVKAPRGTLGAVLELRRPDGKAERFFAWECLWFQTCDTAAKTRQQNDYTAVATWAVTPRQDLLLFDIRRDRLELPRQFDFLIQQRQRYPFLAYQGIEDTSNGIGLIQQGQVGGFPFRALSGGGADKVALAITVATMYQAGKVFHREGADADTMARIGEYESELLAFPVGAHDDMVDCASHAGREVLRMASERFGIREINEDEIPDIDELLGDAAQAA